MFPPITEEDLAPVIDQNLKTMSLFDVSFEDHATSDSSDEEVDRGFLSPALEQQ